MYSTVTDTQYTEYNLINLFIREGKGGIFRFRNEQRKPAHLQRAWRRYLEGKGKIVNFHNFDSSINVKITWHSEWGVFV